LRREVLSDDIRFYEEVKGRLDIYVRVDEVLRDEKDIYILANISLDQAIHLNNEYQGIDLGNTTIVVYTHSKSIDEYFEGLTDDILRRVEWEADGAMVTDFVRHSIEAIKRKLADPSEVAQYVVDVTSAMGTAESQYQFDEMDDRLKKVEEAAVEVILDEIEGALPPWIDKIETRSLIHQVKTDVIRDFSDDAHDFKRKPLWHVGDVERIPALLILFDTVMKAVTELMDREDEKNIERGLNFNAGRSRLSLNPAMVAEHRSLLLSRWERMLTSIEFSGRYYDDLVDELKWALDGVAHIEPLIGKGVEEEKTVFQIYDASEGKFNISLVINDKVNERSVLFKITFKEEDTPLYVFVEDVDSALMHDAIRERISDIKKKLVNPIFIDKYIKEIGEKMDLVAVGYESVGFSRAGNDGLKAAAVDYVLEQMVENLPEPIDRQQAKEFISQVQVQPGIQSSFSYNARKFKKLPLWNVGEVDREPAVTRLFDTVIEAVLTLLKKTDSKVVESGIDFTRKTRSTVSSKRSAQDQIKDLLRWGVNLHDVNFSKKHYSIIIAEAEAELEHILEIQRIFHEDEIDFRLRGLHPGAKIYHGPSHTFLPVQEFTDKRTISEDSMLLQISFRDGTNQLYIFVDHIDRAMTVEDIPEIDPDSPGDNSMLEDLQVGVRFLRAMAMTHDQEFLRDAHEVLVDTMDIEWQKILKEKGPGSIDKPTALQNVKERAVENMLYILIMNVYNYEDLTSEQIEEVMDFMSKMIPEVTSKFSPDAREFNDYPIWRYPRPIDIEGIKDLTQTVADTLDKLIQAEFQSQTGRGLFA